MARAKACAGFSRPMTSWRSVTDREVAQLRATLADARQRRTFAAEAAQRSRHVLLTAGEEQGAVNIKGIVIRTFQALLATPSLLAGFHALASGGKTAGSAWSQHLLEALLIIAVLEWVLRCKSPKLKFRSLTADEWNEADEDVLRRASFDRGTRSLYDR